MSLLARLRIAYQALTCRHRWWPLVKYGPIQQRVMVRECEKCHAAHVVRLTGGIEPRETYEISDGTNTDESRLLDQ